MSKQILVNASPYETRVATLEDDEIRQLHIEREQDRNVVGNIYKGVVKRVLPGMQAAFLELGLERTAFLYVDDIIDEPFGTEIDYMDEDNEEEEPAEKEKAEAGSARTPDEDLENETPIEVPDEESDDGLLVRTPDDEDEEDEGDEEDQDEPAEKPRAADREREKERDGDRDREREGRRDTRERAPSRREAAPRGRSRNGEREGGRDGGRESGGGGRGGRYGNNRRNYRGRGRHTGRRHRSASIQDLLKEGQELLVQVAKAPIGTKGARLTTHISLPGRNLVLMPTVRHLGISRRIGGDRERRRLRDMFMKLIGPRRNVGFIVRTVAEGKSFRDLKADAEYLLKLWVKIQKDAKQKRAPSLIHEDLSLSMRAVRDFFTDEVDAFVIDDAEEFERVQSFIGQFMPRLKSRVKLFRGPSQLFEHYGIEAEISRALGKKVWLKSGGYLLVDQSEALTAIDVNTGRYVGSKSLEETILKTNLEAVKEIAYQLRIRNVGGIIIIDLIDMETAENREKVYHALQEALGEDKAKTNILKISDLGLVEMTRKRTHEDLVRYLTEPCSYCDGRGYHKSKRTVCFEIFREIEKESITPMKNIVVFANPDVVSQLTKEEKEYVKTLEKRLSKVISIKVDKAFHVEQYEVFGKN